MTPQVYLTDTSELQTCWVSLKYIYYSLRTVIHNSSCVSTVNENEALLCPCALWEIHMLFGRCFISISVQHASPLKMVIWFKTMWKSFCVCQGECGRNLIVCTVPCNWLSLSHDLLFALFIVFIQLRSINNHRQHRKPQNSLPKRVSHVKDIWGHIIKL